MTTTLARSAGAPRRGAAPGADRASAPGDAAAAASFLPFCRPTLGADEERAVVETLRSGWLTNGPRTLAFEAAFARACSARFAVGLNSGTAALHLALLASGVGPGDEVVTTPITFVATANVIVHVGATPVFADVEPDTLNLDARAVERAVTTRTRAIIPVHFAGHPCDMDPIRALARQRGLAVIEDAAHALGAAYRGRPVGSLGDVTCFSLYATKNITTGEGGFLVTDDAKRADAARSLALHGLNNTAWQRYGKAGYRHPVMTAPGFNYTMFDLQAALGLAQLAKAEAFRARRREIVEAYDAALADVSELRPLARRADVAHAYHLYVVVLRGEELAADRDAVLDAVQAQGIGLGVHFRAVHLHPHYRHALPRYAGTLPVAEYASEHVLSLPLYPTLTGAEVRRVVAVVKQVLARHRRRR